MSFLFKNLNLLDPRWKEARGGYEVLVEGDIIKEVGLVYPARWLPVHWQWSNFADMWEAANFGVALRNSVVRTRSIALGSNGLASVARVAIC